MPEYSERAATEGSGYKNMEYSDGVDRPAWYDGTALTRGIEEYFAKPVDDEIARLKTENADMRKTLRLRSNPTHKGGGIQAARGAAAS
jgi:hypothetical protein